MVEKPGALHSPRRPIQLSGVNWGGLRERVARLCAESGARCAFLMDLSGRVLIEAGSARGLDPAVLAVLMANSMATSLELAELMGEESLSTLHFHEGKNYDVYGAIVDEETFTCLVLNRHGTKPRVGMVWLHMKRAVADFRTLLDEVREELGVFGGLEPGAVESAVSEVWKEDAEEACSEQIAAQPDDSDGGSKKKKTPLLGFGEALRLGLVRDDLPGGSERKNGSSQDE